MGGLWGAIATGIFADKAINPAGANGLIHGSWSQFGVQILTAVVVVVFAFGMSFLIAKVVDQFWGLSVSESEEQVGLDISQHGEEAYY
jgi:Amt family ammonium transporter